MNTNQTTGEAPQPKLDPTVAQSARVWNYWLGGNDNYAADRRLGEQIRAANPRITEIATAQRAFLVRAVAYLANRAGVHQFLNIGAGLPTASNTHEVAQWFSPRCRTVYVDHDPLVTAHARALLTGRRGNRSPAVLAGFFGGPRLLKPGIVPVTRWYPEPDGGEVRDLDAYGGIGRKP